MAERFKAHDWKSCEVKSLRRFKSSSPRQKKARVSNATRAFFWCDVVKEEDLRVGGASGSERFACDIIKSGATYAN